MGPFCESFDYAVFPLPLVFRAVVTSVRFSFISRQVTGGWDVVLIFVLDNFIVVLQIGFWYSQVSRYQCDSLLLFVTYDFGCVCVRFVLF